MTVSNSMSVDVGTVADHPEHGADPPWERESSLFLEQGDAAEMGRLRQEIDDLNVEMLRLLENRGHVALQIMNIKRRNRLPTHDPAREEVMLKRLVAQSSGIYRSEGIRDFYRTLFRLSVDTMNEWRQPVGQAILTGTARR
jgi:chorismate mutase